MKEELRVNIPGPMIDIFYTVESVTKRLNELKFERYKLYANEWQRWRDKHKQKN